MGSSPKRWLTWVLLWAACGCTGDDADHLARVGRKTTDRLEGLTGGAPGKLAGSLEALRAGWDGATADARVAARLRWDRDLADARIEVRSAGGVVELRGTVADLAQRRRAVELARTTVGVEEEKLIDALEVGEPPP